jgi:hypothetical protein
VKVGHTLVHVSAFQYPKTTYVLLGLKIRPVGDEDPAIGLRTQCLRVPYRRYAASEDPDASGNHLPVERVDGFNHRCVLQRRLVVVGEVARDQKLRHILLL